MSCIVFWLFRYKTFSATPSTTPSKEYMAMGNLLAQTPLRRKDGTIDDEDYYSESDEIVYCGEESLDLVSILTLGDIDGLRVTTDKCGRVPGTKRKVTTLNPRYTTPVCLQNQIRCISKHVGKCCTWEVLLHGMNTPTCNILDTPALFSCSSNFASNL